MKSTHNIYSERKPSEVFCRQNSEYTGGEAGRYFIRSCFPVSVCSPSKDKLQWCRERILQLLIERLRVQVPSRLQSCSSIGRALCAVFAGSLRKINSGGAGYRYFSAKRLFPFVPHVTKNRNGEEYGYFTVNENRPYSFVPCIT